MMSAPARSLVPLAAALLLAPLLAPLLTSCAADPETRIAEGWVRLPAVAGNPGAAYFTLHGGPVDDRLIGVTSAVAVRAELHETVEENGVSSMAMLNAVDVPAGSEIRFEPGGKHVMLFRINPGITPGKTVPMIFTFQSGLRIQYDAPARAAGDTGS